MPRVSASSITAVRAACVGFATGSRSMSAIAACSLTAAGPSRIDALLHKPRVQRVVLVAAAAELIGDKLPVTPPRTAPPGMVARLVLGAVSAGLLATRAGDSVPAAAVVGAVTAAAWTFGGVRYRAAAARRAGSDLPGALAEDAKAMLLAFAAARRT